MSARAARLLALTLVLLVARSAAAEDWRSSWATIRKAAEGVTSVAARFEQTKELKILARPLRSDGRFYFQRPGSVRWQYSKPIASVLLAHDQQVRRFVKQDGAFVADASGSVQALRVVLSEIELWLKGRFHDSESFAPQLSQESVGRVILTPRQEELSRFIERIDVWLGQGVGAIDRVEIHEGASSVTRILFRDVMMSQTLPAELFTDPEAALPPLAPPAPALPAPPVPASAPSPVPGATP